MRLKMLVSMAGPDRSVNAGEETDLFSGDDAKRLIEAGFAVPVAETKMERAVKAAPETRKGK